MSYKPAVTDPVVESIRKGIEDLGLSNRPTAIRTAQKYFFHGGLSREQIDVMCRELLANPVIQDYIISPLP